jgi:uncharacterized protein YjiS (DUF1127 family)
MLTKPAAVAFTENQWLRSILRSLNQVDATIGFWAMRRNTRRALAELEPHQLTDIGKTTADARHESGKAFWRA